MAKIILLIFLFSACATYNLNDARIADTQAYSSDEQEDLFVKYLSTDQLTRTDGQCSETRYSQSEMNADVVLMDKDRPLSYLELGLCYRHSGDLSKSLYYFDLGLSVTPSQRYKLNSAFLYNIALIYFQRKTYFYTKSYLDKALKSDKHNLHAQWGLALLFIETGHYQSGLLEIESLLNRFPSSRVLLSAKGALLFLLKRNDIIASQVLPKLADNCNDKVFLGTIVKEVKNLDMRELEKIGDLSLVLSKLKLLIISRLDDDKRALHN